MVQNSDFSETFKVESAFVSKFARGLNFHPLFSGQKGAYRFRMSQEEFSAAFNRFGERSEFRQVLREVVSCLRRQLDIPGVSPFNPEELTQWFHSIQSDDIRAVWDEA